MYHSKEVRECVFEVKDEDMELMAAAEEAGTRLRLDEMVVHAPPRRLLRPALIHRALIRIFFSRPLRNGLVGCAARSSPRTD